MHLLVTKPGEVSDGSDAVDLGQSPGDIVFLSSASSDLSLVSEQYDEDCGLSLRLANLMQLGHNMSVDLYVEKTVVGSKLVVIRLLGGVGYWPYGVEQIREVCLANNIKLVIVSGDDTSDPELTRLSTAPNESCFRIWQYLSHSGADNLRDFLNYCSTLIGKERSWHEPKPIASAGIYWPSLSHVYVEEVFKYWIKGRPVVAVIFYRSLVQANDLLPIDLLVKELQEKKINPLPIFLTSLKDPYAAEMVTSLVQGNKPDIIINCTAFSISSPGNDALNNPFKNLDCPILQAVLSGGSFDEWKSGSRGLSPKDLTMNVALPEVDGRLITRAISFKKVQRFDPLTEISIVKHSPVLSRVRFVSSLALSWIQLRKTKAAERRVAFVVANYPNKDGRLCNGVGLDTPAGIIESFSRLREDGYQLGDQAPTSSKEIMDCLLTGPTNANGDRNGGERFLLADYKRQFKRLPETSKTQIMEKWGNPEEDPFVVGDSYVLPIHRFGNIILGIQPARGYNIDPVSTYHDPDLVPPHGYIAFYFWLRFINNVHAIVHFGKHGNLEWLPGKSVMLDELCYPELVLGPTPNIYPFIVNDPGEGAQAKRRSSAVIIDHLTPPLTRAENYGPLRDLEQLVDEYYQAAGVDPRRLGFLAKEIIELSQNISLDKDLGTNFSSDESIALTQIDNYLCELKELQIRDGLHILGLSPTGLQEVDLLVALTRLERNTGIDKDASLINALAKDFDFKGFNPLDCNMGEIWSGLRPRELDVLDDLWRTNGDTVERLEYLAQSLVKGDIKPSLEWNNTNQVLNYIRTELQPIIRNCGRLELDGLMKGLSGLFVLPGSSGAPTRGRLDVLPTGRNFYSLDIRAVPTPTAWKLGWKSASLLIERYFQDHGEYPKRLAISAWGTANMRTGGDDISQALALMGVQPVWDQANRVTGIEVLPIKVLGRPRVDVVFRISGFFRDSFPAQIDLLDSAVRAVSSENESEYDNPLAAQVNKDIEQFCLLGSDRNEAKRRAGFRIFGSKPMAYGAGLQSLIDEGCWESDLDLATAYVAWGGYAYGDGANGESQKELFKARLKGINLIVHNQDNREHDILDSDDYYQFEGGIAAAVREYSDNQPEIYHNDHSRPNTPRVHTLSEEISRVVRARASNPKWINGIMRHGYKGAFEIAATVDYLFAFAVTANVVEDYHFDQLFQSYIKDEKVRKFISENNAPALQEITSRFCEAIDRGVWHPHSNSVRSLLNQLQGLSEEGHS